jgi:hypothetical protein
MYPFSRSPHGEKTGRRVISPDRNSRIFPTSKAPG